MKGIALIAGSGGDVSNRSGVNHLLLAQTNLHTIPGNVPGAKKVTDHSASQAPVIPPSYLRRASLSRRPSRQPRRRCLQSVSPQGWRKRTHSGGGGKQPQCEFGNDMRTISATHRPYPAGGRRAHIARQCSSGPACAQFLCRAGRDLGRRTPNIFANSLCRKIGRQMNVKLDII